MPQTKKLLLLLFSEWESTLNNLLVGLVGRLTDWVATLAGWAGLGWAWLCLAGWLPGWAGWLLDLAVGKQVLGGCFEYMAIG